MKLNSTQLKQTLSQFEAEVLQKIIRHSSN